MTTHRPSRTVLFLCTGNYYRSRFAEILFNHTAGVRGLDWQAASRGLAIEFGINNVGPLSLATAGRLADLGICTRAYLRAPLQVSAADLERADLIIALKEAEHRPLLRERYPDWEECVEYWHVHDLDHAPPQAALAEIEKHVRDLARRLAGAGGDSSAVR